MEFYGKDCPHLRITDEGLSLLQEQAVEPIHAACGDSSGRRPCDSKICHLKDKGGNFVFSSDAYYDKKSRQIIHQQMRNEGYKREYHPQIIFYYKKALDENVEKYVWKGNDFWNIGFKKKNEQHFFTQFFFKKLTNETLKGGENDDKAN